MAIHDEGTFEGWVPSSYCDDETPPKPRQSPDSWLVRGDVTRLVGMAAAFGEDDDGPGQVVGEGDAVGFSGLTTFGTIGVEISGAGAYVPRDPVPEAATFFCLVGDPDALVGSLDSFVQSYVEMWLLEGGEFVEVECYDWSERTFVLRDGRFVEAGSA